MTNQNNPIPRIISVYLKDYDISVDIHVVRAYRKGLWEGEYEASMDGKVIGKLYRDPSYQFSYPVWYDMKQEFFGHTMKEALQRLATRFIDSSDHSELEETVNPGPRRKEVHISREERPWILELVKEQAPGQDDYWIDWSRSRIIPERKEVLIYWLGTDDHSLFYM